MSTLIPPKGYKKAATIFRKIQLALALGVYDKAWYIKLSEDVKSEVTRQSA